MSNSPATLPALSFEERLRDRMRAMMLDTVKVEELDAMLKAGVDEFVHGPRSKRFEQTRDWLAAEDPRNTTGSDGYVTFERPIPKNTYDASRDPSTLPGIVHKHIVESLTPPIKAYLDAEIQKIGYVGVNGEGTFNGDGVIKAWLDENVNTLVPLLFAGLIRNSLAIASNEMRNAANRMY